jgi:hypothetical protein
MYMCVIIYVFRCLYLHVVHMSIVFIIATPHDVIIFNIYACVRYSAMENGSNLKSQQEKIQLLYVVCVTKYIIPCVCIVSHADNTYTLIYSLLKILIHTFLHTLTHYSNVYVYIYLQQCTKKNRRLFIIDV